MLATIKQLLHLHRLLWIILLLTVYSPTAWAWQGRVVGVSDGDTIKVLHEGKAERIRLYGVDTPEKWQDFGQRAKQFTSDLVFGKVVDVEPIDTDRYGRTVGIVRTGSEILNRQLVKNGLAWVYVQYCKKPFCAEWKELEIRAKNSRAAIWSVSKPIPPWEFRKIKRTSLLNLVK